MGYDVKLRSLSKLALIGKKYSDWLANFFLLAPVEAKRSVAVNHAPLYSYNVSDEEYQSLLQLFSQNQAMLTPTTVFYSQWCACYCLIISEVYRREYAGGEWKWEFFDRYAPIPFNNPQQRYQMLTAGLQYWKRPLLMMKGGNTYYLGTLFVEGGLPIRLLANDKNDFSEVVKYGIEKYTESQRHARPLEEYIQLKQHRLARIFQNQDVAKLFVQTVNVLMALSQKHPLHEQKNPAEYLDQHDETWRTQFPFSLCDDIARNLVNKWLGEAAEQQNIQKTQCFEHQHYLEADSNVLHMSLYFPENHVLKKPHYPVRTALQWQVYEGNHAVMGAMGTVFARLNEERDELDIQFPKAYKTDFVRHHAASMVSIRFFSDGQMLSQMNFPDSQLDEEAPWIWEQKSAQWRLIGTSHYTCLPRDTYRVRLPKHFTVDLSSQAQAIFLYTDEAECSWYQISDSIRAIQSHTQSAIIIRCNASAVESPKLTGQFFHQLEDIDGLPVYRGWPSINQSQHWQYHSIKIGQHTYPAANPEVFGTFLVSFLSKDNVCLLRKRICVLPSDFKYHWQTAHTKMPATFSFQSHHALTADILQIDQGSQVQINALEPRLFELQVLDKQKIPESVLLQIGNHPDGLLSRLKMAFPYQGAYLFDENSQYLDGKKTILSLEDLLGKHIVVSTSQSKTIQLQLECVLRPENIQRTINLNIAQGTSVIYLQQFKAMLVQLFACSHNQDSFIQLNLGLAYEYKPWLQLSLKRYKGFIRWQEQSAQNVFHVFEHEESVSPIQKVQVSMMRLDDPRIKLDLQPLSERCNASDVNDSAAYLLDSEAHEKGIWLIYPSVSSPLRFRPTLWNNHADLIDEPLDTLSLHQAARNYHPVLSNDVINQVIQTMAYDTSHPGWNYFHALKQKQYAHLPLSTFEAWKSLAKHPHALTLAVLELGLDAHFCERMRHELAIVWEWLPIKVWQQSIAQYKQHQKSKWDKILKTEPGLNIPNLYNVVIPSSVLCHSDDLCQHLVQGHSHQSIKLSVVKHLVEEHYNGLRIMHGDEKWLEQFNPILEKWLKQTKDELCVWLQSVSKVAFDRSVTWLPFFIAYVKAGKTNIDDWNMGRNAFQWVDDFYQIYGFDDNWFNYMCAITSSYLIGEQA